MNSYIYIVFVGAFCKHSSKIQKSDSKRSRFFIICVLETLLQILVIQLISSSHITVITNINTNIIYYLCSIFSFKFESVASYFIHC